MQATATPTTITIDAPLAAAIDRLAGVIRDQPEYENYQAASRRMYGDREAGCAHDEVPLRLHQARISQSPPADDFCEATSVQVFMAASVELMNLMTCVDGVISDMLGLPLAGGIMPGK